MITLKHNITAIENIGQSYESGKDGMNSLSVSLEERKDQQQVYDSLQELRDQACEAIKKADSFEILYNEKLALIASLRQDIDVMLSTLTKATQS
jgi:hypothetical protein